MKESNWGWVKEDLKLIGGFIGTWALIIVILLAASLWSAFWFYACGFGMGSHP